MSTRRFKSMKGCLWLATARDATAALAVGWTTACGAAPACPPVQPQVLLERFVSADCAACWGASPPNPAPDRSALVLDWIVPAPPGTDAPLAAAALMEAAQRAARDGRLQSNETLVQSHPLPSRSRLTVEIQDGPALNGYIGLQFAARYGSGQPMPQGLSGWLALVERIPAGEEESPVDRQLVRSVAGPLPLTSLANGPVEHLRAVRVPETGNPERLSAVGWVETTRGRVIAVGSARIQGCGIR